MFSRETLTLEFQKESNAQAEHYSTQTCWFCSGPKPKFCSFDLDLDQSEQNLLMKILQTALRTAIFTFHCNYVSVPKGNYASYETQFVQITVNLLL